MTRATNLELDHKAIHRQWSRLKDEHESLRVKFDQSESQAIALRTENERLQDQIKQKDQLVLNSHNIVALKYVYLDFVCLYC